MPGNESSPGGDRGCHLRYAGNDSDSPQTTGTFYLAARWAAATRRRSVLVALRDQWLEQLRGAA